MYEVVCVYYNWVFVSKICIQRTAVTTARLKGLESDLHLTGALYHVLNTNALSPENVPDLQYDTVVAILYASYCPAQIPSNMVCTANMDRRAALI